MFQKSKKAQFMSVLQAVFSIIILITVVVVLNNRFADFPAVNEIPLQLTFVERTANLYELNQKNNVSKIISDYDAFFIGGEDSRFIHRDKSIDESCFETDLIIISSKCSSYIQNSYLVGLRGAVTNSLLSKDYDTYILTSNETKQKNILLTYFYPFADVQLKKQDYDTTLWSQVSRSITTTFGGDQVDYSFSKESLLRFRALPDDAVKSAYQYKKAVSFEFELSEDVNTIFTVSENYTQFQEKVGGILSNQSNSNATRLEWEAHLNNISESDATKTNRDILEAELDSQIKRDFVFLQNHQILIDIETLKVIIKFPELHTQLEISY